MLYKQTKKSKVQEFKEMMIERFKTWTPQWKLPFGVIIGLLIPQIFLFDNIVYTHSGSNYNLSINFAPLLFAYVLMVLLYPIIKVEYKENQD